MLDECSAHVKLTDASYGGETIQCGKIVPTFDMRKFQFWKMSHRRSLRSPPTHSDAITIGTALATEHQSGNWHSPGKAPTAWYHLLKFTPAQELKSVIVLDSAND